jgi:hypothetical protein
MCFADDIENLRRIRDEMAGDEFSNDEILALGLAHFPGPVSNEQLAQEADEVLNEVLESV